MMKALFAAGIATCALSFAVLPANAADTLDSCHALIDDLENVLANTSNPPPNERTLEQFEDLINTARDQCDALDFKGAAATTAKARLLLTSK